MAITNCCEPGQNFVSTSWLYGGTYNQFRVYMKKFHIQVKFVEGDDPEKIREAIDENTRAVYIESESYFPMSHLVLGSTNLFDSLLVSR